ncbi:MAG: hypothetical protein ACYS47_20395 [Planctomycetota bacterium]|jgi:hypothetical protein
MVRCPSCRSEGKHGGEAGDLVRCEGCGVSFWAIEGEAEGRPVKPREKRPPSAAAVLGIHAGVFAAEVVLAAAVLGLFVGLPVYGCGRLFGAW